MQKESIFTLYAEQHKAPAPDPVLPPNVVPADEAKSEIVTPDPVPDPEPAPEPEKVPEIITPDPAGEKGGENGI